MRDAPLPSLRGEGDGGDICQEGENQRRWMKLTKGQRMSLSWAESCAVAQAENRRERGKDGERVEFCGG